MQLDAVDSAVLSWERTRLACTFRRLTEMLWTCEAHACNLKVRNGEGAIASPRGGRAPQKLCSSNQSRGECTIKTIAERKGIFFRFQHQGRQLGKESANDVLIFFALKTACAVNENSARF